MDLKWMGEPLLVTNAMLGMHLWVKHRRQDFLALSVNGPFMSGCFQVQGEGGAEPSADCGREQSRENYVISVQKCLCAGKEESQKVKH